MGILAGLRRMRHGPLRRFSWLWRMLRPLQRMAVTWLPGQKVSQKLGPYGPFRFDSHFAFSNFQHWGGDHNNGFVALVEACRGKQCVLDIGGHVGLVAIPISRVMAPGGKVYTFEPAAMNLHFLHRHLELNRIDNVEVISALVGDREGEIVFYEHFEQSGLNSVVLKKNHEHFAQTKRPQLVLDSFCEARGLEPEVIKIDVEGGEMGVLRGARKILARFQPTIYLSVHPKELALLGASTEELVALIDSIGYVCREMDGRPVERFRLAEYLLVPRN